jgi:hypothetical protein
MQSFVEESKLSPPHKHSHLQPVLALLRPNYTITVYRGTLFNVLFVKTKLLT